MAFYEIAMLVKNGTSNFKLLGIARFCYNLIKKMDKLEKKMKIMRAYEINQCRFFKNMEKNKKHV